MLFHAEFRVKVAIVSTGEVSIREAMDSDVDQCARLIADHQAGDFATWRTRFIGDLHNENRKFLIAVSNESVLGYGHSVLHERAIDADSVSSPAGYFLSGLLVAPNHRREGIGTLLTRARLEALPSQTQAVYYLADPSNEATIGLHRRLGFVEVRPVVREGVRFLLYRLDFT